MADQSSARVIGITTPFRSFLIVGVGLVMLTIGVATRGGFRANVPGKLVPRQGLLTWQSPSEQKFRTLAIDEAQATFELENVGGTPVEILEVQSSCGCAVPEVQRTPIAPGEIRPVKVQAVPLQTGERVASITLRTDSSASPEVMLRLQVIGSRRPPYLAQALGDLTFSGDFSQKETREIFADQLEFAGKRPLPPRIKTDLPELRISNPGLVEERPSTTPEAVVRKYRLSVSLSDQIRPGRQSGDVSLIDPWDSNNVQTIRAHCERLPLLRAVPSRILIRRSHNSTGEKPVANVLVLATTPMPDLVAELEPTEKAPLQLGKLKPADDHREATFSITLKPKAELQGTYHIRIGRTFSSERIIVPVSVDAEDLK